MRVDLDLSVTHVSMVWTVILGSEEWKDLAAWIRADVESGRDERVAVLRSCFAMVVDIGRAIQGGTECCLGGGEGPVEFYITTITQPPMTPPALLT